MKMFQYVCLSIVNRNLKSSTTKGQNFIQGLNTKNKNTSCFFVVDITDKHVLTSSTVN